VGAVATKLNSSPHSVRKISDIKGKAYFDQYVHFANIPNANLRRPVGSGCATCCVCATVCCALAGLTGGFEVMREGLQMCIDDDDEGKALRLRRERCLNSAMSASPWQLEESQ